MIAWLVPSSELIQLLLQPPPEISEKLIKNAGLHRNSSSRLENNIDNQTLLNNLKIRLKSAVKNEKYEIAAEIRDKIKNIES